MTRALPCCLRGLSDKVPHARCHICCCFCCLCATCATLLASLPAPAVLGVVWHAWLQLLSSSTAAGRRACVQASAPGTMAVAVDAAAARGVAWCVGCAPRLDQMWLRGGLCLPNKQPLQQQCGHLWCAFGLHAPPAPSSHAYARLAVMARVVVAASLRARRSWCGGGAAG